ncbi:unnamed protein product, partial [Mesorhabditis spiculigera]
MQRFGWLLVLTISFLCLVQAAPIPQPPVLWKKLLKNILTSASNTPSWTLSSPDLPHIRMDHSNLALVLSVIIYLLTLVGTTNGINDSSLNLTNSALQRDRQKVLKNNWLPVYWSVEDASGSVAVMQAVIDKVRRSLWARSTGDDNE